MKTLILILTLFISTTFGQSDPIIDGRFANIQGNLFTVNRLSVLSSDNLAMSVLSGRYTLTQTGAQVQTILDGTFAELELPATGKLQLNGDGDTYVSESSPGFLTFVVDGNAVLRASSVDVRPHSGNGDSGAMLRETPTLTNPTIVPINNITDLGIGGVDDTLTLVANSIAQLKAGVDGVMVGFPTGAYKGSGTINAKAVYDDNTLLTGDYVFDESYEQMSITEMESFYKVNKHLPSLTSQTKLIEVGNISLGQRLNEAIVAIEHQAKYIAELERRLSKLEK